MTESNGEEKPEIWEKRRSGCWNHPSADQRSYTQREHRANVSDLSASVWILDLIMSDMVPVVRCVQSLNTDT
jgi:hypothetical protein